jgi:hypothetical protein
MGCHIGFGDGSKDNETGKPLKSCAMISVSAKSRRSSPVTRLARQHLYWSKSPARAFELGASTSKGKTKSSGTSFSFGADLHRSRFGPLDQQVFQ